MVVQGIEQQLTPAGLARYITTLAMSSSFPALLAGTLSKRLLNMLPSSPTGFILLGTTEILLILILYLCQPLNGFLLTPGIDPCDADIEAAELGSEQSDQVIRGSLARSVARQVDIRHVMHAGAGTRHDNYAASLAVVNVEL